MEGEEYYSGQILVTGSLSLLSGHTPSSELTHFS